MESVELAILCNVSWGLGLALLALTAGRVFPQRQGLVHGLWVLVLIRLITPPLILISSPVFVEKLDYSQAPDDSGVSRSATMTAPTSPISSSEVSQGPALSPPVAGETSPQQRIQEAAGPVMGDILATNLAKPTQTESFERSPRLPGAVSPTPFPDAARSSRGPDVSIRSWRSVVATVWFVGVLAWAIAVSLQIVRFRRFLRSARPAAKSMQDQADRVAARLGLQRSPGVWLVPARVPPMLWALAGPPRLLLPSDLWDRLDEPQQETILAHELAHLRRRDHWVRWLEGVVLGIYWWNPLAWWARRQIEKAEEPCCDAWVVWALPECVDAYAEALVATASFLSGPRVPRPLGATGARRVTELRRRLTMILSDTAVGPIAPAPRSAPKWAMPLCLVALILLPVLAPGQAPESTDKEARASESPAVLPEKQFAPVVSRKEIPSTDPTPEASTKPAAGETIGQTKPHKKGEGYGTSPQIPKGMRVVTITADTTTTHSGMLNPGDRVDVFVTFKKGNGKKMETRVLLEGVDVFATEATTRGDTVEKDAKGKPIKSVSLLLTLEQVSYVKLAQAKGTLSLMLQNPVDAEAVTTNAIDKSLLEELNESVSDGPASNASPPTETPRDATQPTAPLVPATAAYPRGRGTPDAIPGEGQPPGQDMKVQNPVVREFSNSLDLVGRFEALERVELRARASGALTKVHAAPETMVKRGDLLFEIDSRVYAVELRKAEAEVARLEAQLRRRVLDFERIQRLEKSNVVSQEEVEQNRGEVDEAKAALAAAQPDIELARLKLEATRITAPIDGRFRPERVGVGEIIIEDKTVLGTIESVNPAVVRFAIDEKTFLNMSRPARPRVEVIEFGLQDAASSQQTAPIIEKLAKEGLPIRRIDGQKSPEFARHLEITRYPTAILLIDGKEVERRSGTLSEEEFRSLLANSTRGKALPEGTFERRGLLEQGVEVQIGLSDEEGFPNLGKLESVDRRINPETGSIECRALVPNRDGILLPGMFARVRIAIGPPTRGLCIPAAAIVRRDLVSNRETYVRFFVRVVNDQNQIERREIELGQSLGEGLFVVASGLKSSDRIAVPPEESNSGRKD